MAVNWKTLFADLEINGYKPAMFDLKGALVDIFDYEMKRLFGTDLKVRVIGEWPVEKQALPLLTIVRLSESGGVRFLGEKYAGSSMTQRRDVEDAYLTGEGTAPETGLTPNDPGQDVDAWLFEEILELCVWSDNKEIADALARLSKAVLVAWSAELIGTADLHDFAVMGGRDERGLDRTSGRPIFWRPFNVTATAPLKLVKVTETVKAVRARQRLP